MYRALMGYLSLRLISASPGLARWLAANWPGAARWLPATAPLAVFPCTLPDAVASDLIVFLPGLADAGKDFIGQGFIAALRERRLAVDAIAVDAHYGYYFNRTIVERLMQDVVTPARERYARIWLVGISLGGLGALRYAQFHAEHINGIVLLAPFLGDDPIRDSILAAGGLACWRPQESAIPDYQQALWAWLQGYIGETERRPPLYLGYGLQDRFAPVNGLLAGILPPERVFACAGKHDWLTWRTLWGKVLDTAPFPALDQASLEETVSRGSGFSRDSHA
jgi:pimeloyl-ACP methyl ester carboxylesterase